ncbi:MAG: hypothetical protein ACYC5O_11660 [Anaerolineae bacterium]
MERIEVHLSGPYKSLMWLLAFTTLGVGTLALWLSARIWPKVMDAEGITLRNGKRVNWAEMTDSRLVTVVDDRGRRVTGRLELIFGKTKVKVVPHSLEEGAEVMAFISKIAGGPVTTG